MAPSVNVQSYGRAGVGCTAAQLSGSEIVPAPAARTSRSTDVGGSLPSRAVRSTVTPKKRVAGADAGGDGLGAGRSAGDRTSVR